MQRIAIGTLFPALPGATDGFVLVRFEPQRFLVLGWPAVVRLVHFVMQRKQLLGIADRVEHRSTVFDAPALPTAAPK